MSGYLLDTNHLGRAIRPRTNLRQRLAEVRQAGIRVGTCVPALCELEVGGTHVRNPALFQQSLHELLRQVRIWPIDRETAREYARVFHEVRGQGRVLSQVDMMLAALARQMKVTLLTSDQDFNAVAGLSTENWI